MRAIIGVTFALAGGGAASALGACSSASPGGTATDASTPEASAPDVFVAPVPEAGTPDADDGGVDAAATSDGGCPDDGGIPDDLACTGLYSDWTTRTIAPDAVAYTPALVFWSDGAIKTRWLYLPPGSAIDTSDMDNWVFPVGTKIWKQFALAPSPSSADASSVDASSPPQVIETRLIWKQAQGWVFLDYRWSADGSSATRLDDGETNVNGTTYEIPATSACTQCHGGRPDSVLGIDLLGLGLAGAQGVTLSTLIAQGRLTNTPSRTTISIPEDSTQKAAAALGWLHVNCGSSCHTVGAQGGATGLYLKLLAGQLSGIDGGPGKVSALDSYTSTVNRLSNLTPNGHAYERIAPGDAAHSLVPLMALSRDGLTDGGFKQMPPIVSHIPDGIGEAPLSAWINALGDAGP
jgi:hypothetical protein